MPDIRRIIEWVLRVIAVVALLALLPRLRSVSSSSPPVRVADAHTLAAALPRWSREQIPSARLTLDSVPGPAQRDWLRALDHAGTRVTWSGSQIVPIGLSVSRSADPAGRWDVAVGSPNGMHAVVGDAAAPLDSISSGSARLSIAGFADHVTLGVQGTVARGGARDSVLLKRILVEGAAGWETKYTAAALAERGWSVDVVSHVAPGVDVRAGLPARPDTSRYAAIVAVDTSAALISASAGDFVRSGGGLVTLRDAASVGPSTGGGIVLERRGDGDVRAYRVGAGRVIRVGYKDLWRRRLTEDDTVPDPAAAHRAFLARVVAAVAFTPRVSLVASPDDDPAPLAALVDRIGLPSAGDSAKHADEPLNIPSALLFGIALGALLLEWASRRLRGAP